MKNYSIVRVGHEYIVRADEESILKVSSRRRAAKLVTDASELLDMQSQFELSESGPPSPSDDESSINRDGSNTP
jgi:hypothetical protein